MADNTTATLGIEVKGTGIKENKQDLDQLNQSAKTVAQTTRELGNSQQQSVGGIKSAVAAHSELSKGATATAKSMGFFRGALQGIREELQGRNLGNLFGILSNGQNQVAASATRATTATHSFRNALNLLSLGALTAGSRIQGLGQFSVLARVGIAGLAAAITAGITVIMEKAADRARVLEGRLQSLLGLSGGSAAAQQLRETAGKSNVSPESLLPATEELISADARNRYAKGFRLAPGMENDAEVARASIQTVDSFTKVLQLNQMTASKASEAVAQYISAIQKGGLTGDLFAQIRKESPAAARAIAEFLKAGTSLDALDRLEEKLRKTPESMRGFQTAINDNASAIESRFSKMVPTFDQSLDHMLTAWNAFVEALSKDFGRPFGEKFDAITVQLKKWTQDVRDGTLTWSKFWSDISEKLPSLSSVFSGMSRGAEEDGKKILEIFKGIWSSLLVGAQDTLKSIGDIAVSIVRTVAGSVIEIASTAIAAVRKMLTESAVKGHSIGSDSGEGAGAVNSPSFTVSDQDSQFMGEEFTGAFASGGSFMVGGSGATDSKLISMAVTPGERVTVTPPQQNAPAMRTIVQQFIFPNVTQPQPFVASAAQVKRALRRAVM